MDDKSFVVGLDLDGVCADFYGHMKTICAEWTNTPIADLTDDVKYGLAEWGMTKRTYTQMHLFAVTQREFFRKIPPMLGAAQAIRRLSNEGARIRIITHRLFIDNFHQMAVAQTVEWLDYYAFAYTDLCFMKDKNLVEANIYVEDNPENIQTLEGEGKNVIAFTNSTNAHLPLVGAMRANGWNDVESIIRGRYWEWLEHNELPLPPAPGVSPPRPRS